jgi:hypothetical protein
MATPPGTWRHDRRQVRRGQEVTMLGGEGRQDAFLVTGTTRVRDVVELFIELDGGCGRAVLEAAQAAGIDVQHLGDKRHVAGGVAERPPDSHPRCVGLCADRDPVLDHG